MSVVALNLGLIRFGGHLPRGGYDLQHDRPEIETGPAQLHRRALRRSRRNSVTALGFTSQTVPISNLRIDRHITNMRDVAKENWGEVSAVL